MLQGRELSDSTLQINALDGLRGFAVLCVFFGHSSHVHLFLLPGVNLAGMAKSGVYLFFILSSFLLTSPFVRKGKAAFEKQFLLNYAVRRIFRIYPLYLFYLLLAVTTSSFMHGDRVFPHVGVPYYLPPHDFFLHLFLIRNYDVTWSISVEFRYYFLLPLVAYLLAVVLKNRIIPSVVLTILLVAGLQFVWPEGAAVTNDNHLGPYLSVFLLGSLLAVLVHGWRNSSLGASRRAAIYVEMLGMAAVLALIYMIPSVYSFFHGHVVKTDYFYRNFILQGILWSLVMFACITGAGPIRRFFEVPVLRYLGFISFSMYLWHRVLLQYVLHQEVMLPLAGWTALLLTIAVSHLSWFLIEKPPSRIRIKLARPVEKPPAA